VRRTATAGCPIERSDTFVIAGLKKEAAALDNELPGSLRRRILTAATARTSGKYRLPINLRSAIAAACIAIAVLIGALLLTLPENRPLPPDPPQIAGLHRVVDPKLPAAWAGFVQKPLTDEIENITHDTESAVRFLVACVAVDPTATQRELPN